MAGILDSKIDMKLNVALLKTLQQANAGDKWTSARQGAYEEIDNLTGNSTAMCFSAINGYTDCLRADRMPCLKCHHLKVEI